MTARCFIASTWRRSRSGSKFGSRRCVSSRTRWSPLARSCHSAAEKNWNDAAYCRRRLAEVQVRDGGRPRRHVGRQQPRLAHEGVDEGALAGLDLPDDGDAKHLLIEAVDRLADRAPGRPARRDRQASARSCTICCCARRQRGTDAVRLERPRHAHRRPEAKRTRAVACNLPPCANSEPMADRRKIGPIQCPQRSRSPRLRHRAASSAKRSFASTTPSSLARSYQARAMRRVGLNPEIAELGGPARIVHGAERQRGDARAELARPARATTRASPGLPLRR